MRLSTHAAGAILLLGLAAAGFGQSTVPRSGFVIITPVSGNIAGLVASETVINNTSLGIAEAGVSPAPLLTTAVLPVSVGPATQGTSAIAIANPSTSAGQVNIRLTDQQGAQMLNTVFAIGSFQQVSRFLNEFFADQSVLAVRRVALLTVTSTIPVAVFGLDFRSNAFATLPITSLTTPF